MLLAARHYILFITLFSFHTLWLQAQTKFITADHPLIHYSGRVELKDREARFSYPGVTIWFGFEGTTCHIHLGNESKSGDKNYYSIIADKKILDVIAVSSPKTVYTLKLKKGRHTIQIFKRNESMVGTGIFSGIEIEEEKNLFAPDIPERKIEFIGNSITCGYGNLGKSKDCPFSPETEDNYLAYGAITARKLKAEYMAVAYSGKGMIRNYDMSRNTIPVTYDQIHPEEQLPVFDFSKWKPDVVVINLGSNDFAKEIPDSVMFTETYLLFLQKIRRNYPNAHIFCLTGSILRDGVPEGKPSLTILKRYLDEIIRVFKKESDDRIDAFHLSTITEDEFGCDFHPNVERHEKMAKELTAFIRSKTDW